MFSAILFPNSKPALALLHAITNHKIVLCDRNIEELREVLRRKAPDLLPAANTLFAELSYELIPAVSRLEKPIRGTTDQPILNAAISYDVDVILTGDKDFLSLNMERPRCMTAAQFLELEGIKA